jgi:acyl carrier protein
MRREEFERRLLEFVRRTLVGSDSAIVVDEDTRLFEEGIVNSLRILDLIAFVEKETKTRIPDEAIRLANFRSVRAIAAAFGAPGTPDTEPSRSISASRPEDSAASMREGSAAVLRTFERRAGRLDLASPLEELTARGELTLVEPGRAVFCGPSHRLLGYFDSVALGWGREMGAEERTFPSRIPPATLARADRPVASPADSILPPAVCYHVYPAFQGQQLARPSLLTLRGRCFRDESVVELSTGRLRDFQMREIVALGSREEVEQFRQELIAKVSDFVTCLDLEGRIETASDPFFVSDSTEPVSDSTEPVSDSTKLEPVSRADEMRGRRLMQKVLPLKYELRLALGENGVTCAAASFNHHLDFFGRRFDLRLRSGATAHSGCVAFGLERWVLAFLARHGADERTWPEPVRGSCAIGKHARVA